jgi:hypothetical protein
MTHGHAIALPPAFSRLITLAATARRAAGPWRLTAGVGIELARLPEHGKCEYVLVAVGHPALSEALAATPWADGRHVDALVRLPDSFVIGSPTTLCRGDRTTIDALAVPLDVLHELQFATERAAFVSLRKTLRWWWGGSRLGRAATLPQRR